MGRGDSCSHALSCIFLASALDIRCFWVYNEVGSRVQIRDERGPQRVDTRESPLTSLFGKKKKLVFPSAMHGEVELTKGVWNHATRKHRKLVAYNPELIGPTLRDPDRVRQSQHKNEPCTYVYYRQPEKVVWPDGPKKNTGNLSFVVVIDAGTETKRARIKTLYLASGQIKGKTVYP